MEGVGTGAGKRSTGTVLGRYGQTVYGMYGTNLEDAGAGTIHACLLGSHVTLTNKFHLYSSLRNTSLRSNSW